MGSGEKPSPFGVLLVGLFGFGLAVGGGYGVWSVVPGELVTTSVCVRSSDVMSGTRRSRRGMTFISKELQFQGSTQPVVFYHDLGSIIVNNDLPRQIRMGDCYRVEVSWVDYEQHLRRPVSGGYGLRRWSAYGRGDLPRVKVYSMAKGEEVLVTPFDAYGWTVIALGGMAFFGLVLLWGVLRAAGEAD